MTRNDAESSTSAKGDNDGFFPASTLRAPPPPAATAAGEGVGESGGERGKRLTRSAISPLGIEGGGGGEVAGTTTIIPLLLASFIVVPIEDEEAPELPPPLFDDRNENQPKTLDFARGELFGFAFELSPSHRSLVPGVPIAVAAA